MLRIVRLTCFIPLMVAAASWDTLPLQNINITGFTTGPIVVDDLFAERKELLNTFKTEF
ncbi:MAG: hypothetical protein JXK05_02030 [Campylobacterales bacterium]|nr:hypothetical protein [Campylobacterales bacterium]